MISLTKRILIIFIFLCIFAWIAADILNFLRDGNETLFTNINNTKYMSSKEKFSNPGSGLKGLHVFSQISDLHISRFYDEQRVPDLRVFCTEVVGIIKPEVVIVSGDLTDAKTYDRVGSRQYEDEWQEYNNLLKETNIAQKTKWLDLRGNHDVFDVLSTGSENNFFSRYSIQGKTNSKSYKYKHQTDDGNVFSFIAVDGCLEPGPKRPFNFFGQITEETLASLYSFSIDTANDTMTFWFGHYPTSTLVSPTPGIRELIGRVGSVYMCGHLHTLLGAAPTMYVRHQLGNLELEVGDWKDNRIFRVFAVDQGLFSFTDVTFNEWPIILITNPKDARFLMPTHEPTDHIKLFSHIRILVFSVEPIVSVDVWIDESYVGAAQQSEGDLYTLPWIPTNYLSGMHTITVNVKDTSQSTHNVTQPFSLDNTLVPFHWWYKFLLMSQFSYILKLFLAFGLLVNIVPLLTMRYLGYRFTMPSSESSVLSSFIQLWLYRLYLISHSRLYYPLVLFAIYIAVGPWFVGEVIQGNIGWCFSFGLYTAGRLIPASTIYSYAFIQYITFNLPLMLVLARVVELKSHPIIVDLSRGQQVQVWFSRHAPVLMLGIFQLYMSITGTFAAYGTMATLVNPVRTWSVPFAFVLHYVACKRSLSKTVYWTVRDHDNGISRDTRL